MRFFELLHPAFYTISALVLLWDVLLAGQISHLRRAPRDFRGLTALCGLLIVPALVVAMSSSSMLTGRAIHAIAWVWPLTLLLFAAQAIYAVWRRLLTPFIGVPIAVFDLLLAAAATVRYASFIGRAPGSGALALVAAESSALGLLLGRESLASPVALLVPLLAPAYPARWRASATLRGALALSAAVWSGLFLVEIPPGFVAVRSYATYSRERLQERPSRDFIVGLHVFPRVRDAGPPPLAVQSDLALLDSVEVRAVSVLFDPEEFRAIALDSVARTLDEMRRDSVLLIVAVGYGGDAREKYRAAPQRYLRERVTQVERIARRLRPDILLPAADPSTAGAAALGGVPLDWWREYLTLSARATKAVSPRTRVGVAASAFTRADSALYVWAATDGSPVDVVGFSFFPSFGGGASLDARLRAADRWIGRSRKDHWVFAAGGFPLTHGEVSQSRAVWGALAWATRQPRVRGLIVERAGDYETVTGLRAASGRLRPAVATLGQALRALEETAGQ